MANQNLIDCTSEQLSSFGQRAQVVKHRLHELSLFSDEELIRVLDSHPRDQLQAFTMGIDPLHIHEWQPVDLAGASGREMLQAISRGRLWFHLFHMQDVSPHYKDLVDRLFSELMQRIPTFRPAGRSATLILSSPKALVYY